MGDHTDKDAAIWELLPPGVRHKVSIQILRHDGSAIITVDGGRTFAVPPDGRISDTDMAQLCMLA